MKSYYLNGKICSIVAVALFSTTLHADANSSVSEQAMVYDQETDLRCSEQWNKLCGDNYTEPLDEHKISLCNWHHCANRSEVIRRGQVCDGTFDCRDLSDECLCDDKRLKMKKTYSICVAIYRNHVESICNSTTSEYVNLSQICDGNVDCLGKEDEQFCQYNCGNRGIQQESQYHECLRHGETVRLNWRHRFDDFRDCDDYSDEWHEHLPFCNEDYNLSYACEYQQKTSHCQGPLRRHGNKKMLASPESYIDSTFFFIMVIILGFSALFGNSALLLHLTLFGQRVRRAPSTHNTISSNSREYNFAHINKMMVISLCCSDLLHGALTLAWGSMAILQRSDFWQNSYDFINSWMCRSIGTVALLANEAGAFTILVIASVRLYTVLHPFTAAQKLQNKHVIIALVSAWIFSAAIALAPLLQMSTILENLWTFSAGIRPVSNLEATVVERHTLENMVRNLARLQIDNSDADSFIECASLHQKSWSELEKFMNEVTGGEAWNKYGYYSQPPSCLPPILVSVNEPGWIYSLSVILLDFCAYLFVMVAYIIVYKRTTRRSVLFGIKKHLTGKNRTRREDEVINRGDRRRSSASRSFFGSVRKQSRNIEDHEMQRRIFFVVATDFACWVPMCSIAFIRITFENSSVKNKFSFMFTIFMVQLNSVINPIIYSKKARDSMGTFAKLLTSRVSCFLKRKSNDVAVND